MKKVVVIGGGTGNFTVLSGFKKRKMMKNLKSQIVALSGGGRRNLPKILTLFDTLGVGI